MFLEGASSPFWLERTCLEMSLKTLGSVTTNKAVDGTNSGEKYTGLVAANMPGNVQALIKKR